MPIAYVLFEPDTYPDSDERADTYYRPLVEVYLSVYESSSETGDGWEYDEKETRTYRFFDRVVQYAGEEGYKNDSPSDAYTYGYHTYCCANREEYERM